MSDYIDFIDSNGNEWTRTNRFREAKETIAAQAAVIEKLREALVELEWDGHDFDNQGVGYQYCSGCGNREELGKHTVHCLVGKALAIPQDITSLEAMIQKAGEVMRERCVEECDESREAIRALPPVKLEDLK